MFALAGNVVEHFDGYLNKLSIFVAFLKPHRLMLLEIPWSSCPAALLRNGTENLNLIQLSK